MIIDSAHAYGHLVGTRVGVFSLRYNAVIMGWVVDPEEGQDHNYIRVKFGDGTYAFVKYMDAYRADFVKPLPLAFALVRNRDWNTYLETIREVRDLIGCTLTEARMVVREALTARCSMI